MKHKSIWLLLLIVELILPQHGYSFSNFLDAQQANTGTVGQLFETTIPCASGDCDFRILPSPTLPSGLNIVENSGKISFLPMSHQAVY